MDKVQISTAFKLVLGAHVADCRFSLRDEGNYNYSLILWQVLTWISCSSPFHQRLILITYFY